MFGSLQAAIVDNSAHRFWAMSNGYAMPARAAGIRELGEHITSHALSERVRAALRVGVHWSTQVGATPDQQVSQVFCSAVPVSYSGLHAADWAVFGKIVMRGAYDACLCVAGILAQQRRARVSLYLTCLGGGAFGNPMSWIAEALHASLTAHADLPVDVYLVHFRSTSPEACAAVEAEFGRRQAARK